MRLALSLLAVLFPAFGIADQVLQYGPAVVQVTGKLSKGKAEHPNGTWFNILILKLDEKASIKGSDAKDAIDVSEENVTEIQVSSMDNALLKRINGLDGKKVTLAGTLFHSHTAWHVRELVMMATSVK
jgi:hypothetical protein